MKVVFVIIGAMIGAGFASGQEIYLFFFSYGVTGSLGIFITTFIIGVVIYKTLKILKNNDINTYMDFLNILLKDTKINKEVKIGNVINIIINLFVLITFFIMISGFGAYFEQEFKINSLIGSGILATMSFFVLINNVKGVVKANGILVPILIGILFFIGIIIIKDFELMYVNEQFIKTNNYNFIVSAILYASYNSILLIPVIITLKKYINNNKQILYISILSSFIILILSFIVFFILTKVDIDIAQIEMPAVYVVSNISRILKYLYGFIILVSIFTTTISLGMSFLQNTAKTKKTNIYIAASICIISVVVSKIGFSNLVSSIYPIFGYIGIFQILRIFWIKN